MLIFPVTQAPKKSLQGIELWRKKVTIMQCPTEISVRKGDMAVLRLAPPTLLVAGPRVEVQAVLARGGLTRVREPVATRGGSRVPTFDIDTKPVLAIMPPPSHSEFPATISEMVCQGPVTRGSRWQRELVPICTRATCAGWPGREDLMITRRLVQRSDVRWAILLAVIITPGPGVAGAGKRVAW